MTISVFSQHPEVLTADIRNAVINLTQKSPSVTQLMQWLDAKGVIYGSVAKFNQA